MEELVPEEVGITMRGDEDFSVLTMLRAPHDDIRYEFEHAIARFFTTKEARELRKVCREFLDMCEVTRFKDMPRIGKRGWDYNVSLNSNFQIIRIPKPKFLISHQIKWFRCSFPAAIAASLSSYDLTDDDIIALADESKLKVLNITIPNTLNETVFPSLTGICKLFISHSYISGDALKWLRNIQELDISGCINITDAALHYLRGIEVLHINYCTQLTGNTFCSLRGIKKLYMGGLNILNDAPFEHLVGINTLYMHGCRWISSGILEYIAGVEDLDIMYCSDELIDAALSVVPKIPNLRQKKINAPTPLERAHAMVESFVDMKERRIIDGYHRDIGMAHLIEKLEDNLVKLF